MSSDRQEARSFKKFLLVLSEFLRYIAEEKRDLEESGNLLQLMINTKQNSEESLDINEKNVVQKIISSIKLGKITVDHIFIAGNAGYHALAGFTKSGKKIFTIDTLLNEYLEPCWPHQLTIHPQDTILDPNKISVFHTQMNAEERKFFYGLLCNIRRAREDAFFRGLSQNIA